VIAKLIRQQVADLFAQDRPRMTAA
jgi:hypothetical protein